jgi:hypothetical protein
MGFIRIRPIEKPVKGVDLFPDLSDEIDRRIATSELRIKTWVMGGIVANLCTILVATVPMVFYLGQISRDIQTTVIATAANTGDIRATSQWTQDRMIWETSAQQWMMTKGFVPPARKVDR